MFPTTLVSMTRVSLNSMLRYISNSKFVETLFRTTLAATLETGTVTVSFTVSFLLSFPSMTKFDELLSDISLFLPVKSERRRIPV